MENRHAFIKFYIPHDSENKLKIPPAFIRRIRQGLPETVLLRDRYDNLWQIKAEGVETNWYFKDGWKTFVEENMVKGGDMIEFDYFGRGFFGFKIFDTSGIETKGVGGCKRENTENRENTTNVNNDGNEKQPNDGGASTSENRNENKRYFDWFGVQIFQSGSVPKPVNPYFVTKFNQSRKKALYIPIEVISGYQLELPGVAMLVDPQGREFKGKRKIWKDGRIFYAEGWKILCQKNSIKNGDYCICEFTQQEGGELRINVSLVRADRQQA